MTSTVARTAQTVSSPSSPARSPADYWNAEVAGVQVLYGAQRLAEVGEEARRLGARRVLVVTDPGVSAAGHPRLALDSLERAGLSPVVFDEAPENPTSAQVGEAARRVADGRPELLVGLGGGSVLDTAKAINFLLTNGGSMVDYQGLNRTARPLLPSIAVPTTAGTGTEARSYALISDDRSRRKMTCGDRGARPRTVILDSSLLVTAPRPVAAAAALDALAHAVESYVCRRGNPVSRMLAGEAWRLVEGALTAALASPGEGAAQGRLLLGAHLAGAAIEQSMLGAGHACANPLAARYDARHGVAVGILMPHVVRFNGQAAETLYRELAGAAALDSAAGGAEAVARRIAELATAGGLPSRLRDIGVEEGELVDLAPEAARQWAAAFNPRPLDEAAFLQLYRAAW